MFKLSSTVSSVTFSQGKVSRNFPAFCCSHQYRAPELCLNALGSLTSTLTKQGRNILHIPYLGFTISFLSASFSSERGNFLLHVGVILTAWRNKTLAPKLPIENLNTYPWNLRFIPLYLMLLLPSPACNVSWSHIHLLMGAAELAPARWQTPLPLYLPKSFTSFWAAGSSSEAPVVRSELY